VDLHLQHISHAFKNESGRYLEVVRDVSLDVASGELICLLGPSGSGKSTLLNLLVGLVELQEGKVLLKGKSVPNIRSDAAYMFQQPRLLMWMSARKNIEFALRARDIPQSDWGRRIDRYLGMVGLTEFADWYPARLSGGMQQRVALARALAVESPVMLMDEPFSGLDEFTARELRDELLRISAAEGKTILFVTHNALEATYLADRVVVFTPRPARIATIIEVGLPRPRSLEDPDLLARYGELLHTVLLTNAQVSAA
jgi:ABC-type nitrate/sulfonate/bicarbonate transport system ATPase subunit